MTLIELLVATAVTLVALSAVVAIALPWTGGIQALGAAADLQQRARVAAVSLTTVLQRAGRGAAVGSAARAARPWPALLPCRWAPGQPVCQPGTDGVTVLGLDDGLQVVLAQDMAGPSAPLTVVLPPGCDSAQSACRLVEGTLAVIADASGARDEFTVSGVSADGRLLTHIPALLSRPYQAGAIVGRSGLAAYYARPDAVTGALQLRAAQGSGDFPLLDGLVGLAFDYFGDPDPPETLGTVEDRVRVTYGPAPPPPGEDDAADSWPAGENCTFAATADAHVPRLSRLASVDDGLASLSSALFADGPWCPDDTSAWRFDADLLRIRRVRVRLRFQALSTFSRGADTRLFARPGQAQDTRQLVPDLEITFDVALRNPR